MGAARLCLGALLLAIAIGTRAEDLVEAIPAAATRAQVAIIIDDLGYHLAAARQLAELPYALTLAVIPFTPYSRAAAELAHSHHKEVMLHTPMEPEGERHWESGLNVRMDQQQFTRELEQMLADVPHVRGVNNHGGSLLTQDKQRMGWLMDQLAQRQLYFIDSRTSAATVAQASAIEAALANGARDVFLDNDQNPAAIATQFDTLIRLALSRERAIAIGHPYPHTRQVLGEQLPRLRRAGIAVVSVSALLNAPPAPAPAEHSQSPPGSTVHNTSVFQGKSVKSFSASSSALKSKAPN